MPNWREITTEEQVDNESRYIKRCLQEDGVPIVVAWGTKEAMARYEKGEDHSPQTQMVVKYEKGGLNIEWSIPGTDVARYLSQIIPQGELLAVLLGVLSSMQREP